MLEELGMSKHEADKVRNSFWVKFAEFIGWRWFLFAADFIAMKTGLLGVRGAQLNLEHLPCRFCESPIDLMGSWVCECGFKRPGSYFGRCPKCLTHPGYIDCPSCGFTMDVR